MMLSLYVPVSSLYQEQLIATMSDGSHTLRSGNPKFKITKVLRPALDQILAKQIRVKGINTVVPMLRTLCERHEKFKDLREEIMYKHDALESLAVLLGCGHYR